MRQQAGDLLELHECLTVQTDWAGPLLVDVTWHPAAVRTGLPGTLDWDGDSDMVPAVVPTICHAVRRPVLRAQKEALRARLYSSKQPQLWCRRRSLVAGSSSPRMQGEGEVARRAELSVAVWQRHETHARAATRHQAPTSERPQ